jgi:dipeptidyl aminopeptidase/acylaminoacyl peptidase
MRAALFLSAFASLPLAAATPVAPPSPAPSTPRAHAAGPLDTVLGALERVREFGDVAISADGRRAAWMEKVTGPGVVPGAARLMLTELATGRSRRIGAGKGALLRERDLAFAPDGRRVAFLSDAARSGQMQLYVLPVEGGAARQLTRVRGQLGQPRWSPDGKRIAFLHVVGSETEAGALGAHARDRGLVVEAEPTQRLAVLELATGAMRLLGPEDLYVYDFDWFPDGTRLSAEAVHGSGTNDYWTAELFQIDAESGHARHLWQPVLQIAEPRVAPDGRAVALIHGLMSDEGSNGGDVWLIPLDGGDPRNLTPDFPGSARHLHWLPSGELLIEAHLDGGSALFRVAPASGELTKLWAGAEVLGPLAVAAQGATSVTVRHSFARAPEVWAGPIGEWKALTRANEGALVFWGGVRKLHWDSDGQRVQGWLVPPRDVQPERRYPLVVVVHGGPAGAHAAGWPARWNAVLPSQGYFVLMPNPRGSFGFGARFAQANVKDFGHGDLRDILAGVDEALKSAPIDPERIGIVGWSYGGFMAMWAPTQTTRFKAAVAGAGIVNWQSYYGQNRIQRWMIPFFGASVYDDPQVYARSSAINFIKSHKTPTLVLHGERDSEVPAPQGYEFWRALRAQRVFSELVIYPDEGHAIRQREHRRDLLVRTLDWFTRYLR